MPNKLYQRIQSELEEAVGYASYSIEQGPIREFIDKLTEKFNLVKVGLSLENVCCGWHQDHDLELGQLFGHQLNGDGSFLFGTILTKGFESRKSDETYFPCENPEVTAVYLPNSDRIWLFYSVNNPRDYTHSVGYLLLDQFSLGIAQLYSKPKIANPGLCTDLASLIYKHIGKSEDLKTC